MERDRLPPTAIVDIVFFALLFNLVVMAIGFAIVAGVAGIRNHTALVETFTPAAGFLGLLATAFGILRSALVNLLASLAAPDESDE